MKVMVLAAGRGERMRPLTDHVPKPLLTVGGISLIEHLVAALVAEGFRELVVNHAWHGAMIEERLGDGRTFGASIEYSAEGDRALETGGGIRHALPLLGSDPFIAVNADIWTDYPFSSLPDALETLGHLVLVDNPAHHPGGDFTLAGTRVGGGRDHRLTFSGIGVYRPELFAELSEGRFPLAPLLFECCSNGQLSGVHYTGEWWDVGTPERLEMLDRRLRGSSPSPPEGERGQAPKGG
jgi:MurNAc alpha-1-phosphate uridylyltransferase